MGALISRLGNLASSAFNEAGALENQDNSQNVQNSANQSTTAAQNQDLGQTNQASAASIQNASNQVVGNNNNQGSDIATQAATDQGNAILDAAKTAATIESQREAGFSAALGSAAKS